MAMRPNVRPGLEGVNESLHRLGQGGVQIKIFSPARTCRRLRDEIAHGRRIDLLDSRIHARELSRKSGSIRRRHYCVFVDPIE